MATSTLYRRLRPKIQQYQATTGKVVDAKIINEILQQQLADDRVRDFENERLGIYKGDLALRQKEQKDNARAAKASGQVQMAGTAVQGAMLYHDWKKDTAIPTTTPKGRPADMGPLTTTTPATTASTAATPATTATATPAAGAQPAVTGGAQTQAATPAMGAQATTAADAGTAAGATAAPTATGSGGATATGTGTTATTSTAPTMASTAGSALGVYGGASLGAYVGDKLIQGRGSTGRKAGGAVGGAAMGAKAGTAIVPGIGTVVGAVVGAVVGLIVGNNDSVICSELHRQGYIPDRVRELSREYSEFIDKRAYLGYRMMFNPVVRLMQRSRIMTAIVRPFGVRWAYEMASRLDPAFQGNITGKVLLKVGVPICRSWYNFVSRMKDETGGSYGIS